MQPNSKERELAQPADSLAQGRSGTSSMEDAGGTVVDEEFPSAGSFPSGQEAVLEFDLDRDDAREPDWQT